MRPCCGLNPLCSSIIISVFYIPLIIPLLVPSPALSSRFDTICKHPKRGAASRVLIESGASNSSCISKQQRWMWNTAPRNELIYQPLHGNPCFESIALVSFTHLVCCCCTISPPCALVSYSFLGIIHLNQVLHFLTFVSSLVSFFDSFRRECLIRACRRFICSRRTTFPKSAPIDGRYNIIKAPIDRLRQVFLFSMHCLAGSMLLKGYYCCSLIDAERRGQCNDPAVSPPQPPLLDPAPCILPCWEDHVLDGSGG